jgi:uncharacterized FlaG/YvyC family protein
VLGHSRPSTILAKIEKVITMTADVASLTGITRLQSNSNFVNRGAANVVAINSQVSEKVVQETTPPTTSDIKKAARQVNDFVKQLDRNLEFSVDESSGRVIITVREPETGKIIRQIPPEELLVIAKLVSENFASAAVPTGILLADEG